MRLSDFHAQTVDTSLRLRPFRRLSRKIADCCLLTPQWIWKESESPATRRRYVMAACRENNVGSAMIFIAILGIIINLIWQWWLHRKASMPQSADGDWLLLRDQAVLDIDE